jgi:hypothetical protein
VCVATIPVEHFQIKIANAPKENVWLPLQLAQVCRKRPKNHVHMPCQFGTSLSLILLIALKHQNPDAISNAVERKTEDTNAMQCIYKFFTIPGIYLVSKEIIRFPMILKNINLEVN